MLVLTDSVVFVADDTSEVIQHEEIVQGAEIRCGCAEGDLAAVAFGNGSIALITDGRVEHLQTGISERIECLDILADRPLELLIGTEPAHLYRLGAGGAEPLEAFDGLDCQSSWYTPWGGPPTVRSLANSGDCLYADIHVGSIMRSMDRGNSWEPVTSELDDDVHQVATCAAAPASVYANTADAVFVSEDRGQTWDRRAAGLPTPYGRAIAVHPTDPDCILASVSEGPHSDVKGQLYRSDDTGRKWTHVIDGFPSELKENLDTFQLGFSANGRAWAAIDNLLYVSDDRGGKWMVAWEAPTQISSIAC